MHADNVLEDLADGEEETGSDEVDYTIVSNGTEVLTRDMRNLRIGRNSPRTRRTRTASRMKKTTMKMSGTSWYRV